MQPPLHPHRLAATVLCLSILVVIAFGCAPRGDFASLIDQGPLPLSTENPFVAQNLFLAQEAEKSRYLFEFLSHRGAPSAIALNSDTDHLELYYPQKKERYLGVRTEANNGVQGSYEWIIRGPDGIPRSTFRYLSWRPNETQTAPIFKIGGHSFRFSKPIPKILTGVSSAPIPTPKPETVETPKKKPVKRKVITVPKPPAAQPIATQPTATPTPAPVLPPAGAPLNSDAQALLMSQGFAERTSDGGVVHTVKEDGEKLEKISEWYAGDATHAAKIAAASNRDANAPLKKGTRLTVPAALVKNQKQMGSSN